MWAEVIEFQTGTVSCMPFVRCHLAIILLLDGVKKQEWLGAAGPILLYVDQSVTKKTKWG